jgi:hypothetical protein
MALPSYLSTLCAPSHHNAYRRALADEKIDFSTDSPSDSVALRAAKLFLPAQGYGLGSASYARVNLNIIGDSAAQVRLDAKLIAIADGSGANTEAGKGRAVLKAIAEAIFPALNTGNVSRTRMAGAAAMEIAVAITDQANSTIGMRAAMGAVNSKENPLGCRLGEPSEWGIGIRAREGKVSLCESTAWDEYHWFGEAAAPAEHRDKGSAAAAEDAQRPKPPRNVKCQDGKILIADVCTTFTVKTDEWWLTRKLLPRRPQHATVGAKIERVHFQSPDKTLQDALAYENGTARHVVCNWLARLCRFMRGICASKAGKSECERELIPTRTKRSPLEFVPECLGRIPEMKEAQERMSNCLAYEIKLPELIDNDARRVGQRSGTWGDSVRYHGKVDLNVSFHCTEDGTETQTVSFDAQSVRLPADQDFERAAGTRDARAAGPDAAGSSRSRASSSEGGITVETVPVETE